MLKTFVTGYSSTKRKVISATRYYNRTPTILVSSYLERMRDNLNEVKLEFAKFFFDTSNYSSYQTNISDRERNSSKEEI